MPVKKEIVYPFFLECCQYATDTFWETIMEDLAYGKAPSGTYISKGFLVCGYKGKEFSYRLERKEPSVLYEEVYKLLVEKLGILSQKEKAQKRLLFHEMEKTIKQSRQEWGSIRRKNIKDVMYEKYVIEMKKKYSLSPKQCKYLLSIILLSILFKTITTKDIVYKDDRIQDIVGIEFETGKVLLKRPLYSTTQEVVDTPECEEHCFRTMSENWNKYLKTLQV